MSTTLTINGQTIPVIPKVSIFDHAESVGIRVPTSCHKQGKCKECMVEVVEGMELLSPATPEEDHLRDRFRLSCRTTIVGEGRVVCHTMRRGQMHIERRGFSIPSLQVESRDGYGIAMDLGTTTVVL